MKLKLYIVCTAGKVNDIITEQCKKISHFT